MQTEPSSTETRLARRLNTAIGWLLVLAVPIWMLVGSTRLLATDAYLQIEYGKADFPADPFGFSQDDRREYAPYAVRYLLNDRGIDYLGDLTFPDGRPMYNARELRHMADVKAVAQTAFGWHTLLGIVLAGAFLWLSQKPDGRPILRRSLIYGGTITIATVVVLVTVVALNWNTFFGGFHRLFFESGTWRFEYSDTLIRLFPERFWFDAALTIGGLTVGAEIILMGIAWAWDRQAKTAASADAKTAASADTAAIEAQPDNPGG